MTQELDARYGLEHRCAGAALKVYATINLEAPEPGARGDRQGPLRARRDPAAALVTEDPHNGRILAMAQSATSSQYNLAAQGHRQPGSTFKAIVLADALSRGVDPEDHLPRTLSHTLRGGLAAGLSDVHRWRPSRAPR